MAEPGLFDHAAILSALNDLAEALSDGEFAQAGVSIDLIVVGGAYLALRDLRVSTDDIDTVTRLGEELTEVIAELADRHDLARDWLNDHAAPYKPQGLTFEQCELVFEKKPLRVYLPSEEIIFLMKLAAARNDPTEQDRSDMIVLWPRCGFQSPAEAVQRFFDAYPAEGEDAYLEKYVAEIAQIAEREGESDG